MAGDVRSGHSGPCGVSGLSERWLGYLGLIRALVGVHERMLM
jgi:hypothetical protein